MQCCHRNENTVSGSRQRATIERPLGKHLTYMSVHAIDGNGRFVTYASNLLFILVYTTNWNILPSVALTERI